MNVTKIGNRFLNSRFMNAVCSERAGDAAATIALLSTTTKDLVNCAYYTTQSLHNKKIPEEKRKFVAGIDLSNGILNVLSQLTIGMYIKNKTPVAFDYLFRNSKMSKNAYNAAKGGFSLIVTLVVAQVLLKRILTPFISTPMAHYFKEYADKKDAATKKTNNEQDKNTETAKDDKTEKAKETEKTKQTIATEKAETQQNSKVSINSMNTNLSSPFKSFEGLLKVK